jgi:hypothetical protein
MSIYSQATSMYLWCAQPLLQGAVAALLWHRKLRKQFPVFFAFLLVQVAFFAITFPLYGRSEAWYFWLFWLEQGINAVLGFKIIHEIFLDVFRPYPALQDLGTPIFKWAGAVMVLVSVVVAASNSFPQSPLIHAIVTMQRSVRTVQFGLILFLVIFARFLGVSRRQLCFGIALGFGFFAGAELFLLATYSGKLIGRNLFNLLNMFAYDVSVAAWAGYALSAKTVRERAVNPLRTQRWERSLTDLQHATPSDSLIPMFEGMVERAFSRTSNVDSPEDLQTESTAKAPLAKSAGAGSKSSAQGSAE